MIKASILGMCEILLKRLKASDNRIGLIEQHIDRLGLAGNLEGFAFTVGELSSNGVCASSKELAGSSKRSRSQTRFVSDNFDEVDDDTCRLIYDGIFWGSC